MVGRLGVAGLLLAALVSGCGGGGGGGSGGGDVSPPVDSGQTFSAAYVPLAAGDRRLYRVTAGADAGSNRSEVVVGRTTVGTQSAWELRDESGVRSYLALTATGLTALSGPGDDDALLQALGTQELLRFGLVAGQTVVLADRSVNIDADGDGRPDTAEVRVNFTVVGFGEVSTAQARYANAAQVRTEITLRIALASGERFTSTADTREWYAAGVGRVRSSSSTVVDTQPAVAETEEVAAYSVAGQRSDSVAPVIASTSPAEGSAAAGLDRVVVRFSKPVDAGSLEGAGGLQLLDGTGAAVAVRRSLAANLQDLTLLPDAPLQDGRYTLRAGTGIVDWSGNTLAARDVRFAVDLVGPRLASATPAPGSEDFPLQGTVSFTFDEPLALAGVAAPSILVFDATGGLLLQTLPATLNGATLSAPVASPLARNTAYRVQVGSGVTDLAGNAVSTASATVSFRTDPGPLARPVSLASGVAVMASTLANLDDDGLVDLVYAGRVNGVAVVGVRRGQAGGGFGPPQTLINLQDALGNDCEVAGLAVGDFDADGRRDIALPCNSFLQVFMQTAPGVYAPERPRFNGVPAQAVADVNGDGRDDLVLMGTPPGADVGSRQDWYAATRIGAGNWAQLVSVQRPGGYGGPGAVRVADLGGDRRPDLVWAEQTLDGESLLAWALAQDGGYGAVQTLTLPGRRGSATSLAVGDVDGDGQADIVYARQGELSQDDNVLLVLRGLPGGGFAVARTLTAGRLPGALAIGDIDGDGRADILVARPNGQLSGVGVLLQRADGSFDTERNFETTVQTGAVNRDMTLVDVDGDGRQDLVIGPDLLLRRPVAGAWPAAATPPAKSTRSVPQTLRSGVLGWLAGR